MSTNFDSVLPILLTLALQDVNPDLCPIRFETLEGTHYQAGLHPRHAKESWFAARKICKACGGDLFVANSSVTRLALRKFLKQHQSNAWIGLHEDALDGGKFTWLDQTDQVANIPWAVFEPQPSTELQRCVSGNAQGTWFTWGCNMEMPYVCQKTSASHRLRRSGGSSTECKRPYINLEGTDKCVAVYRRIMRTWNSARHSCRYMGNDLLRIDDDAISSAVEKLFKGSLRTSMWIGLRESKGPAFVWLSEKKKPDFFNWDQGEPRPAAWDRCAYIVRGSAWRTANCNGLARRAYICYHTAAGGQFCKAGFKKLTGVETCVKFNSFQNRKWNEARRVCVEQSSDLLVIRDNAMATAVKKFLSKHYRSAWIGLHEKQQAADNFVWLDDTEKVRVSTWDTKEPAPSKDVRCVYATGLYRWKTSGCNTERLGYICEQVPPTTTTASTTTRTTTRTTTPTSTTTTTVSTSTKTTMPTSTTTTTASTSTKTTTPTSTTTTTVLTTTRTTTPTSTTTTTVSTSTKTTTPTSTTTTTASTATTTATLTTAIASTLSAIFRIKNSPEITPPAPSSTQFSGLGGLLYTLDKMCKREEYEEQYPCGDSVFEDIKEASVCVRFDTDQVSFDSAKSTCEAKYKGHLVTILDKELDLHLTKRMPDTTDGYWIGLWDRKINGTLTFQGDGKEATWFNWDSAQPHGTVGGETCVWKSRLTGRWRDDNCAQERGSICQTVSARNPGPPDLKVNFHLGYNAGYMGRLLLVECSSFVDRGSNMSLAVVRWLEERDITKKNLNLTQMEEFVKQGKRCFARSKISTLVTVTEELYKSHIRCCWQRPDQFRRCSHTPAILVIYVSRPPKLHIEYLDIISILYMDQTLSANCSAFVGSAGQLHWRLNTSSGETEWRIRLDGSIWVKTLQGKRTQGLYENANRTSISVFAGHDLELGPWIESTFKTTVTFDLKNGTLACTSYSPHDPTLNTRVKTSTSPTFLVRVWKEPSKEGITPLTMGLSLLLTSLLMGGLISVAMCISGAGKRRRKKTLPRHHYGYQHHRHQHYSFQDAKVSATPVQLSPEETSAYNSPEESYDAWDEQQWEYPPDFSRSSIVDPPT